jgi:hypothetical protein
MKVNQIWRLKDIGDFTEAIKLTPCCPMDPMIRIVAIRYFHTLKRQGKIYDVNMDMVAFCPSNMSIYEAKNQTKGEWSSFMGIKLVLGKYELATEEFIEKYEERNVLAWENE